MSFTNAELQAIYAQLNQGSAGPAVDQATVIAIATQTRAGQLSEAEALQAVYDLVDDTTGVAALTYQFFTGSLPTAAGFSFLVNSATNTTDLNDPYYAQFNQENRLINFSLNLALGTPANQTAFAATFGSPTTLVQAVTLAYETIIGRANAEGRGVDVDAAIAFLTNSANVAFYSQIATQRGGIPASDAVRFDLAIKAIAIAELLHASLLQDVGNYADSLNQFYASLHDATPGSPGFGANLLEAFPPSASVTLTANADTLTANVFEAPRVFTPGGNDQVNSLNDDDILTGVGTNPTLNFTFVNDTDTGDVSIAPRLNNVHTVNIDVRADANVTLDLQDSDKTSNIKIAGIDDGFNATVNNINYTGVANLEVENTNAPASTVSFLFDDSSIDDPANKDVAKLTLDNVTIAAVVLQGVKAATQQGFETINLVSTGDDNEVGTLTAQDVRTINITGDENFTLGTEANITFNSNVEATYRTGGLLNVAGSLTTVDASGFTANLDITLGAEISATLEGTSGDPVNFVFKGGSGNDTLRLDEGTVVNVEDSLDGGAGANTLVVYGDTVIVGPGASGFKITNFQTLDIKTGHDFGGGADTVMIDADRLPQLVNTLIRNEGATFGTKISQDEEADVILTNYTDAQANALSVYHGTTGNNGFDDLLINVTHKTDGAANTTGVTILTAENTEPRFNFTISSATEDTFTITDSDNESNSVRNLTFGAVDDLVVKGGQVGKFLNLDTGFAGIGGFSENSGNTDVGAYRKDATGGQADSAGVADVGTSTTERYAGNINASTFTGDLIVRVDGVATGKSYVLGSGNDVLIFDQLNNKTAGLSISDSADGGAGSDVLGIDGHGVIVTLGASEWTNVKNFETIRLFSTATGVSNAGEYGKNGYNLKLTNDLIDTNGVAAGVGRRIAIVNDSGNTVINENGVTIDALSLDAKHSFTYDGEEGAGHSADRFIMADANVNAFAVIDGGYSILNSIAGNNDVFEVRNAAVVTIGDLVGVSNVSTLEFTNDQAANQNSILELDTATIDRLVNSSHTAGTGVNREVLVLNVLGNPLVPLATTTVDVDVTGVDFTKVGLTINTTGNAFVNLTSTAGPIGGFVTFNGGNGNDIFVGTEGNDILNGGGGNDNLTGGNGNDTMTGGTGADTLDSGAGDDSVDGGDGNDSITAGTGLDTVDAGPGADFISLGPNNSGDGFRDTLVYDVDNDFAFGSILLSDADNVEGFLNQGANSDIFDIVGTLTSAGAAQQSFGFTQGAADQINNDRYLSDVALGGSGAMNTAAWDGKVIYEVNTPFALDFQTQAGINALVAAYQAQFNANTVAGTDMLFIAYDNTAQGNAVILHYQEIAGAGIQAGEITLVGVFESIFGGSTGWTDSNFN